MPDSKPRPQTTRGEQAGSFARGRPYSRRDALALAGGLLAAPAWSTLSAEDRSRPTIGIQLYIVAAEFAHDPGGTLRQVRDLGFRDVELPNLLGFAPTDLRRQLVAAGLRCPSLQVSAQAYRPGRLALESDLHGCIAAARQLGADFLVCSNPWLPQELLERLRKAPDVPKALPLLFAEMRADDWRRHTDVLSHAGARCVREGLTFAYHNHNAEFRRYGDFSPFNDMLTRTDPKEVGVEMDVGWVSAAGEDPVSLIRENPARFPLFHLKDHGREVPPNTAFGMNSRPLGMGMIDWEAVLSAIAAGGAARALFIEQEPPFAGGPFASAKASLDHLRSLRASRHFQFGG